MSCGVLCLPGSRDHRGGALVTVRTNSSVWWRCSRRELLDIFLYFSSISRKEVLALGLTVLVDVRSSSLPPLLTHTLCYLQKNMAGFIHSVLILADRDDLDMDRPSASQVVSMKSLQRVVDVSQLPVEMNGSFCYCHRKWLCFRSRVEKLTKQCEDGICLLQRNIHFLESTPLPLSIEEMQVLLASYRCVISNVLQDSQLVDLQKEGGASLCLLRQEESSYNQTDDYREEVGVVERLYQQVDELTHSLVKLCNARSSQMDFLLTFSRLELGFSQVGGWIQQVGFPSLRSLGEVDGSSSEQINKKLKDFTQFSLTAERICQQGQGLLQRLSQWDDLSSASLNPYRVKVHSLGTLLQEFSEGVDATGARLHKSLALYQFYNKAYDWALQGLRCLETISMQDCTEAGKCQAVIGRLESSRRQHPPIPEREFLEMRGVAEELRSASPLQLWTSSWRRCQETHQDFHRKMEAALRTREHLLLCTSSNTSSLLPLPSLLLTNTSPSFNMSSPPSSYVTPPASHVTPPTSSVTPPSSYMTHPTSSVTPPSSPVTPPSSHMIPPTSHVTLPSSHVTPLSSSHVTPPTSSVTLPSSHVTPPTSSMSQPSFNVSPPPSSYVTPPSSHMTHPTSSVTPPSSSNVTTPSSHVSPPSSSHVTPSSSHVTPPSSSHAIPPSSSVTPPSSVTRRSSMTPSSYRGTPPFQSRPGSEGWCSSSPSSLHQLSIRGRSLCKTQSFDHTPLTHNPAWPPRRGNTGVHIRGLEVSQPLALTPTQAQPPSLTPTQAQPPSLTPTPRTQCCTKASKQQHVVEEMVSTEREYVQALRYVMQQYWPEMERSDLPQELRGQRCVVFGNLENILHFHSQFFLKELEACWRHPLRVADCFLRHKEQFGLYALYSKNKPKSDALLASHGNSFFREKQLSLGDRLDLASYLLKPIQRMSKYALLLKELSPAEEVGFNALQAASHMVNFQLRHGNDLLAMDTIHLCDVNLKEQGSLLRQDLFTVLFGRKKTVRRVFLFEELLLFSKPRAVERGVDILLYKHSFKTADLGLTASVGGCGLQFEVWFRKRWSRGHTLTLQAASHDIKQAWTDDITRLLWSQANRNKEVRMKEMVSMGVGSKPFLDIKASDAAINDRAVDYIMKDRGARTRASIAVSVFDHSHPLKRLPFSRSSLTSDPRGSGASSGSLLGPLNLHLYSKRSSQSAESSFTSSCLEDTSSLLSIMTTESSGSSGLLSVSTGSDSGCVSSHLHDTSANHSQLRA
ncbi:unnamed protein product [Merluccius merluccius]